MFIDFEATWFSDRPVEYSTDIRKRWWSDAKGSSERFSREPPAVSSGVYRWAAEITALNRWEQVIPGPEPSVSHGLPDVLQFRGCGTAALPLRVRGHLLGARSGATGLWWLCSVFPVGSQQWGNKQTTNNTQCIQRLFTIFLRSWQNLSFKSPERLEARSAGVSGKSRLTLGESKASAHFLFANPVRVSSLQRLSLSHTVIHRCYHADLIRSHFFAWLCWIQSKRPLVRPALFQILIKNIFYWCIYILFLA